VCVHVCVKERLCVCACVGQREIVCVYVYWCERDCVCVLVWVRERLCVCACVGETEIHGGKEREGRDGDTGLFDGAYAQERMCCGCVADVLRMCCGCVADVLRMCCGCVAGVLRMCCGCVDSFLPFFLFPFFLLALHVCRQGSLFRVDVVGSLFRSSLALYSENITCPSQIVI